MINEKIAPALLSQVKCCTMEKIDVVVYVRGWGAYRQISKFNVVKEFPFLQAAGINCFPHELERLSRLSCVEYIQGNSKVFTMDEVSDQQTVSEFQTSTQLTGKGVTLAVLDTGISPHLDLCAPNNRIKQFFDAETPSNVTPYDDNGHGTFVTGIAVGNGFSSGKMVTGVAPKTDIVGVKVIRSDGESGAFAVLDGMQYVLDNKKKLDIKVACMSFGSNPVDFNDPLKRGAEVLVANGITVVCASGNSGQNTLKSPAISLDVVSVGAVDEKGTLAEFTSRGYVRGRRKPELYANGVNVLSIRAGGTYGKMSGTSASAPYVAGACCLLLERFPSATPHRVKEMLLKSCKVVNGNFVLQL